VNIRTLAIAGAVAVVSIGLGPLSSDAQAGEYGYPCKTAVSGQYVARSATSSCQFVQAIQRNARAHPYRDPSDLVPRLLDGHPPDRQRSHDHGERLPSGVSSLR
jgi:hypothetical protein